MHDNVTVAFVLAMVLFVPLLVFLGVTSFNTVRKRMETESWKRLNRLSYVFFALVYACRSCCCSAPLRAPRRRRPTWPCIPWGLRGVLRAALVRFALDRRAEGARSRPPGADGDGEGAEVGLTSRAL